MNDPAALPVIRHSTAHVMADAVQRLYPGTKVTFGPAVENGFYYDFDRRDGGHFSEDDFERIEGKMREIIAADHPFRREVDREGRRAQAAHLDGRDLQGRAPRSPEGEISLYRHGDWVDLCEGPHVPSTGFLRAVKLTSVAGAYWRGDERNPMLQRIYGTAFPPRRSCAGTCTRSKRRKKRDHRKLGKELELFGFHRLAPASPFFLPRGAHVYNACSTTCATCTRSHGYKEVITPQIFDRELFETSGHLPNYRAEHVLRGDSGQLGERGGALAKQPATDAAALQAARGSMRFGVKPMNCPCHCLIYGMTRRSYRELPMRIADFGRLHRYERARRGAGPDPRAHVLPG